MPTPKPVVVGVDGSAQDADAIRYGAQAARRADVPLVLVHVVPRYAIAALSPYDVPLGDDEIEAIGRDILHGAVEIAERDLPASQVSPKLVLGEVVPGLIEEAAEAGLLVLGDDRLTTMERLATGSVIAPVAARAVTPVVSVPIGWAARPAGERRRILVGVKDYERVPTSLLQAAFTIAQEQDADLELAHVWNLPGAYGEVVASILDYPSWQAMVDRHLHDQLAPYRAQFPGVEVRTSAWFGQVAHVLRERAEHADLLVLTRRDHGFPFGHFGSTGRALLRACTCPVEVLPIPETSVAAATPAQPEPVSL